MLRGWVAGAILLASGGGPLLARQGPLTLQDAVRRSVSQNDRVTDALANVQRSEIRLRAAGAAFRPSITPTASGALGQSDLANQSYGVTGWQRLPFGTELRGHVTSQSSRNQLGTYYFTDTAFTVNQSLLRGFGREFVRRPVDAAEATVRDARRQLAVVRLQLTLQTAAAYLRLVGQQSFLRAADRAVDRATALRDDAAARLQAGRVSLLDTLRSEQLLAQARAGRLDALAAIDDAKDELRVLMHLNPDDDFAVVPAIPTVIVPPSESDALATALATRPEIAAATDALDQSERGLRAARSGRRAQLDLGAGVIRQEVADAPLSGFGLDGFQFAGFATFSVPLFDDQQDAEYRTALIERDQRARDLDAQRLRVTLDVRRAFRELGRSEQSAALARSSADLASREVDVARLRFDRGLSSNLDVVAAEAGLLAAESRAIVAEGQLTLGRLSVLAAIGTLDAETSFR